MIIATSKSEDFFECLKLECEKFILGDPFDEDNNVGCVVSLDQFKKINNYIQIARDEGAEIYQAQNKKPNSPKAWCVQPTIIRKIYARSRVTVEEIFGSVVVLLTADSIEEALEIANNSNYGLAGAVWIDDINEAYYVAKKLFAF